MYRHLDLQPSHVYPYIVYIVDQNLCTHFVMELIMLVNKLKVLPFSFCAISIFLSSCFCLIFKLAIYEATFNLFSGTGKHILSQNIQLKCSIMILKTLTKTLEMSKKMKHPWKWQVKFH